MAEPLLIDEAQAESRSLHRTTIGEDVSKDESWLQSLIHDHPGILPSAEFGPEFNTLHSLGREIPAASGRIDNLYLSSSGCLVVVETKRAWIAA